MSNENTPEETLAPEQDLAPASRYAGIEAAFAADMPTERDEFELLGQPCYIVYRPMNGSAQARYESLGNRLEVDTTKRTIEQMNFTTDQDKSELELLLATVEDFCLAKKSRARGTGEEVVQLVVGSSMTPASRRITFQELSPALRKLMVQRCLEVNHLAPLGR